MVPLLNLCFFLQIVEILSTALVLEQFLYKGPVFFVHLVMTDEITGIETQFIPKDSSPGVVSMKIL